MTATEAKEKTKNIDFLQELQKHAIHVYMKKHNLNNVTTEAYKRHMEKVTQATNKVIHVYDYGLITYCEAVESIIKDSNTWKL